MTTHSKTRPLIIAHRGACAYLPEHTLEAKALAYGMGADYLEQDVVATRDDQLLVSHDIHLDTVTDVAERYPTRARDDGRFYARDFDLAEIKTLNAHERTVEDGKTAVYEGRFPANAGRFSVATLCEEIEMLVGLNKATGRDVGIYPEVKRPAWHRAEGVDLSKLMLDTLNSYGFTDRNSNVYVQCFDWQELTRIRDDLGCQLKLVQLIGENSWEESDTDYDELKTAAGLKKVAVVADGIGPWMGQLYTAAEIDGQLVSTGLVSSAHAVGLTVHPFTFRADDLYPGFESFSEMVRWFVDNLSIDGLFTDFPDLAREALDS
jgi:glycerophosphoryl diester phosphodiesterase